MDRFVTCLVVFAILLFAMEVKALNAEIGPCECGAFRMQPGSSELLMQRKLPIGIPCTVSGAERCQRLCVSLAEAAVNNGAEVLCASLVEVDGLIVEVNARNCDQDQWVFTGFRSAPVCCVGGESIACQ